jgi:hypothetical protein
MDIPETPERAEIAAQSHPMACDQKQAVLEDLDILIQKARDIQSVLASRQELPIELDEVREILYSTTNDLWNLQNELQSQLSDAEVEVYRTKIEALQAAKHELRQHHHIRVEPSEVIPVVTIQDQFNVWEILSRQIQLYQDAIWDRVPVDLPKASRIRPNRMDCTIKKRELLQEKVLVDEALDLPAPIGTIVLNPGESMQMYRVMKRAAHVSAWYNSHGAHEAVDLADKWAERDAVREARRYNVPDRSHSIYVTGGDRIYQGELFTYPTRYFDKGHSRIFIPRQLNQPLSDDNEGYLMLTNERGRKLEFGPARGRPSNMQRAVITEEDLRAAGDKLECDICHEDYQVGEEWSKLPCDHRFHADCVQPWLTSYSVNGLCPYRCN